MSWLLLVLGVVLILVGLVDLIWTALWVDGGAGPVTRAVAGFGWRVFHSSGRKNHRLLTTAGPAILALTVATWVLLLWAGWFLVFASEASAVLSSSTSDVADTSDRLYFVGYTVFTLGNGDFKPNGDWWQVATALAAGSGLLVVTLAITYLISVISAAVSGRAFASQVSGLGGKPAEAVAAGWNGKNYAQLGLPLQTLSAEVSRLGEQLLAYPVLQYFHAEDPSKSPMVALARLEQIVAVANYALPRNCMPAPVLLNSVRSGIENVLDSLPQKFVREAADPLKTPDLEPLRAAELPHLSADGFENSLARDAKRRKKLRGLLQAHGWSPEKLGF